MALAGVDVIYEKDQAGSATKYVTANGLRIARIDCSGNRAFSGTALAGSLGATMFAGMVSGAAAGAVSYVAEGTIATATGQQFEWSAEGFGKSVLFGAVTGSIFAGVGYGIGKYAPRILRFGGERVGPGEDPSSFWNKGTYRTSRDSLTSHLGKHGLGRSALRYTDDALAARDSLWGTHGVRQGARSNRRNWATRVDFEPDDK